MTQPLRLIHLESNPADAELIYTTLRDAGVPCHPKRVQTRDEFLAALRQDGFSLILADTTIPGFDGAAALTLSRTLHPDVPFLFVSGAQGEEYAIDMMQRGATDYISKQRLGRLAPSIKRTLRDLDERLERRRAEDALRQSEKQFRQAQKMEAVGRLAGGLAHDFNNLLTVIMGHSQVLIEELAAGTPVRAKIEEMHKAGERAASLIRQLMAFSRKQPEEPKVLPLNSVVGNVDSMLRRLIGEDIQLVIRLDPDDGHVKADPGQVEQVIMNLAVNARDAMPNGGRLTVETSNVQFGQRRNRPPMGAEPGSYIALIVRDTGHGMDEDTQSHVFEPFFTTKEKGKGTGLGLSTVYGIVKQSGGCIEVESKPGRGATFKIFFPRIEGVSQGTETASVGGESVKGRETVLLVEDEPGVRRLVNETLRLHGYTVLEARHGIEALLTGAKHAGPIHLLLTDVVMPQMSGPEVAEKLATVRPDVKVLYMSGYPDHPAFSKGGIDTEHSFLQKPFTPSTLAQKVREVLDGSIVA